MKVIYFTNQYPVSHVHPPRNLALEAWDSKSSDSRSAKRRQAVDPADVAEKRGRRAFGERAIVYRRLRNVSLNRFGFFRRQARIPV
jgi:hypothetical protein